MPCVWQVKDKMVGIMLLARVPCKFDVWPKEVDNYEFNLQTASNVVAPPTLSGELVKLDKGPAIESMKRKHHLRPFMLDVYRVDVRVARARPNGPPHPPSPLRSHLTAACSAALDPG